MDLSSDLPLIIEWVDNPARVDRVMPRLREMVVEGLITVQPMEVVTYSLPPGQADSFHLSQRTAAEVNRYYRSTTG